MSLVTNGNIEEEPEKIYSCKTWHIIDSTIRCSPKFKTNPETVWYLTIEDRNVLLYLESSKFGEAIVDVKISSIYPEKYIREVYDKTVRSGTSLAFQFINLLEYSSESTVNQYGSIKILCEIYTHIIPQLERLIPKHLSYTSKQFKSLLQNENLSDVTLIIDKQEFRVHKNILAARSAVFKAMFQSDMKETKEARVEIEDIKPEVMKQVLLYMYTGIVDLDSMKDLAGSVLAAADKYALEELKLICAQVLSNHLTINNVFDYLALAEQYEVNCLKKEIVLFIGHHYKSIAKKMPSISDSAKSFTNLSTTEE